MKKFNTALLSFALFGSVSGFAQQGSLYVDTGTKGHEINPGMYGIFFEEINHSGDGGPSLSKTEVSRSRLSPEVSMRRETIR